MLGSLLPIWGIGALVVWWYRREARRLGIPWNDFIRMTPAGEEEGWSEDLTGQIVHACKPKRPKLALVA